MSKDELISSVKEGLDCKFDGANNWYSIFYVFGADRYAVEKALIEIGEDDVSGYESPEGVFAFVGWKIGPYFAETLSSKLPGKLVVGETSWDYFEISICKNGKSAEKNKDYEFCLEYEASDEWNFSDTMYSFTDVDTGYTVASGSGMVHNEELTSTFPLTTSKHHGIDWDKWHGEEVNELD